MWSRSMSEDSKRLRRDVRLGQSGDWAVERIKNLTVGRYDKFVIIAFVPQNIPKKCFFKISIL